MSNEEKKRRQDYKASRKQWIIIQIVLIVLASLLSIITGFAFNESNKTQVFRLNHLANPPFLSH